MSDFGMRDAAHIRHVLCQSERLFAMMRSGSGVVRSSRGLNTLSESTRWKFRFTCRTLLIGITFSALLSDLYMPICHRGWLGRDGGRSLYCMHVYLPRPMSTQEIRTRLIKSVANDGYDGLYTSSDIEITYDHKLNLGVRISFRGYVVRRINLIGSTIERDVEDIRAREKNTTMRKAILALQNVYDTPE